MSFEEKVKFCAEQMASDYGITQENAEKMILDMDIESIVFKYYEDCINEEISKR